MFWGFGHKTCGILAPLLGIKPAPSELEREVLTTGLPRKSSSPVLLRENISRKPLIIHANPLFLTLTISEAASHLVTEVKAGKESFT